MHWGQLAHALRPACSCSEASLLMHWGQLAHRSMPPLNGTCAACSPAASDCTSCSWMCRPKAGAGMQMHGRALCTGAWAHAGWIYLGRPAHIMLTLCKAQWLRQVLRCVFDAGCKPARSPGGSGCTAKGCQAFISGDATSSGKRGARDVPWTPSLQTSLVWARVLHSFSNLSCEDHQMTSLHRQRWAKGPWSAITILLGGLTITIHKGSSGVVPQTPSFSWVSRKQSSQSVHCCSRLQWAGRACVWNHVWGMTGRGPCPLCPRA